MGSKGHGTWAQWHEDVHDHPKTLKLAAALAELGVPEEWATDVACGQLHRLACWALRDNGYGQLGHLTPLRFAQIVRWPHLKRANELWQAWTESGFIDDAGTEDAVIHDFRDYFKHVLRFREMRAGDDQNGCNERAAPVQRTDSARAAHVQRTPNERARARASRIPDTGVLPPYPPEAGAPPDGGEGGEDRASRSDPPQPPPGSPTSRLDRESPPAPNDRPSRATPRPWARNGATGEPPPEPTELVRLWLEHCPKLPKADLADEPELEPALRRAAKRRPSLEAWEATFRKVARMPHLCGSGSSGFEATLAWVCQERNRQKVDSGYYAEVEPEVAKPKPKVRCKCGEDIPPEEYDRHQDEVCPGAAKQDGEAA